MKSIIYLSIILLALGKNATAQPAGNNPDTLSFRVEGNCSMCKERIEEAARGKGVKHADWNMTTKMLTLVYDGNTTTITRSKQRIADAGHDNDAKTARDAVYNELPYCCRYRHGSMEELLETEEKEEAGAPEKTEPAGAGTASTTIRGVVVETDEKGNFIPLEGASVMVLGSNRGTYTDSNGVFSLGIGDNGGRLVVSFTGHKSDTLSILPSTEVKVILAANNQLKEIKLTSRQRSNFISTINPIRTQIMTERELFKAACCNLSESFETNPSVDVSYNDAVTGSKQIQLLGLSGNYTQLTVENLPGPRGIASPLGLNSIAGPWIESIQLTKGVGSVANGFESIAGQINVELKKAGIDELLYLNGYVNDFGKTDINLNLSGQLGNKWSSSLLLHDDFLYNSSMDFNKDGFRDQPTGNLFSAVNRWKYEDAKGMMIQFGWKYLLDDKTGGETSFDPSRDKYSSDRYGLGIHTRRFEGFAKIGYVFPAKKYKSIGLQISTFHHSQDAYFGLKDYDAVQDNFYSNLIYQSIIGSTSHKFRTGLSIMADRYSEKLQGTRYDRTETVPGAFLEYTYSHGNTFSLVAGLRGDHNNLFGFFATPRLHLKYEPARGTTLRLSGGRGQRTANIIAENMSVLVSSRQLQIPPGSGKAYGLEPEIAWNEGVSLDQKFRVFNRNASISIDYYRTDFQNQVVVDLDQSPGEVHFYNLEGKSYSNSFQTELHYEMLRSLEMRLAYRLFDVKTTYHGQLMERPLVARHRAFANLALDLRGWKLDYTVSYNGMKRIPSTAGNPVQYQLEDYSPAYWMMNAQLSRSVGKDNNWDFYIGAENLTNYFQDHPVLAADQPFSSYFDASMVWGPLSGRMLYAGFRYKVKRR